MIILLVVISVILYLIVLYDLRNNRFKLPENNIPIIAIIYLPIIGPLLYFYYKRSKPEEKREFLQGKRRFS